MWQIGVWEEREGLSELVCSLAGSRAQIRKGSHPALLAGDPLDLLVVSPAAVGWAGAAAIYCRTALLPDSAGVLARSLLADRAVSYGLSGRDTITLSSLAEGKMCVAVQREIIRLDGALVERQELILDRAEKQSPELLLARVGVCLLLGKGAE